MLLDMCDTKQGISKEIFQHLGQSWQSHRSRLWMSTCATYSTTRVPTTNRMDELRHMLFTMKKFEMETH